MNMYYSRFLPAERDDDFAIRESQTDAPATIVTEDKYLWLVAIIIYPLLPFFS